MSQPRQHIDAYFIAFALSVAEVFGCLMALRVEVQAVDALNVFGTWASHFLPYRFG